jgi:hypothetical protein
MQGEWVRDTVQVTAATYRIGMSGCDFLLQSESNFFKVTGEQAESRGSRLLAMSADVSRVH